MYVFLNILNIYIIIYIKICDIFLNIIFSNFLILYNIYVGY